MLSSYLIVGHWPRFRPVGPAPLTMGRCALRTPSIAEKIQRAADEGPNGSMRPQIVVRLRVMRRGVFPLVRRRLPGY